MAAAGETGFRALVFHATVGPGCRPHRVLGLLAGVVLLSGGDLYMTLLHLKNFGMLEANPLARGIMAHGTAGDLVAWKFCTVGLAVGILFFARKKPSAEFAAVFCCLVLTWLTWRWVAYSDQVAGITGEMQELSHGTEEPRFVTMAPGG